ncbi:hypothetical protein [Dipodfec virus RodF1_43]|uniref:Uncharacterized protein n=1 Tax=Dipodfec virus RodF1_43 TaxID=2929297 RepID=A0A976R7I8_9VIRU|nr:hypothetical protein [Dipodfec virus RodF1_43]
MEDKIVLYCYRYVWKEKGQETLNFRIVTDTEDGLQKFADQIIQEFGDLERLGREYVCEYDVSKLCLLEPLYGVETETMEVVE